MPKQIEQVLQKYWGYKTFLPLQKQAMQCVSSGRDSIVVLSTGGGKSLCFQAPALTMPGLAVVISPLISLMKDQVDALTECGVAAARIDSTQSGAERDAVLDSIRSKDLKLLYLAPERLLSNGFITFLRQHEVSFIAIDEAHCVSMWGHDFRPDYRQLGGLKEAFPGITVHAYTATATERVRRDIAEQLCLANPEVVIGSFDRPNLIYKTQQRGDRLRQVCEVLARHKGETGIVYCIRRADVDDLCAQLIAKGYRAAPYHAGMDNDERKRSQNSFIEEKVDTIVATVAFGMGIDKSNVRYVIHVGMPKSLEHYQQESGRAGRDGLEAECCLFHSAGDFGVWKRIMSDMEPQAQKIAFEKLDHMSSYCTGVTCRHKAILNYFGEETNEDSCDACDVCLGDMDVMEDSLVTAQKIISCVVRLEERFGSDYTAAVLTGSREERILTNRHGTLSTYGLLSDFKKRVVADWIGQLIGQRYLRRVGDYNVLNVTETGWRVLKGNEKPHLLRPATKPAKTARIAKDSWEGVDKGLFEVLRTLRRKIADEKQLPAYVIFGDATLRDIARRRPSTRETFLEVNGVADKRCQLYGDAMLEAIQAYCAENNVDMDVQLTSGDNYDEQSPPESVTRPNRSKAQYDAFDLFRQGRSTKEVALLINRAVSTTAQYLIEYIKEDGIDNPYQWVDEQTVRLVGEAAGEVGIERLRPIFEYLDGKVSYEQVKIILACSSNNS